MGAAADLVRHSDKMYNAHDSAAVRATLSADVEWSIPGAVFSGADQVMGLFEGFWEAFPDLHLAPIRIVEDGDIVVVRATASGTHRGTLHMAEGDIPPTNRKVELSYTEHYKVSGGLIVAGWLFFDRLEFLEQLGVGKVAAGA